MATRCQGWDVAALYAHHSVFPLARSAPPPPVDGPVGEPLTATEILRRFNAPDGVAHSMAGTVADRAVSEATAYTRRELVDRFSVHGPRALQGLRQAKATVVVPWPSSGGVVTLVEAPRASSTTARLAIMTQIRLRAPALTACAPRLRRR